MRIVNGWRYLFKERDRINIELRLGTLTFFRFYVDVSNGIYSLTILNLTVEL